MGLGLAVSFVVPVAASTLPAFEVGSTSLVTPTDANTYYGSAIINTSDIWANDGLPVEIKEMARALKGDADLIYEYVRNNVETIPMFGVSKGALGAAIDLKGTAFDQAQLMVELARESGLTARYQVGTISQPTADVANWVGATSANGTYNATALEQILADGGIPASINGATTTFTHIWVEISISGTWYAFDPSYKQNTVKDSINLKSAMGYSRTGFMTAAIGTAAQGTTSGINYIYDIDESGIESQLTTYATTLLTDLKTSHSEDAIEDVIGGREIVEQDLTGSPQRLSSLSYVTQTYHTWTGDIPNQYRTSLRVHFQGLDKTLYSDEIYSQHLVLRHKDLAGDRLQLALDFEYALAEGDTYDTGFELYDRKVELSVNHPYAASSGTYMDRTTTHEFLPNYWPQSTYVMFATIVHGWGDTDQATAQRIRKRFATKVYSLNYLVSFPTDPQATAKKTVPAAQLGASWVSATSELSRALEQVGDARIQNHHFVGVAYDFPARDPWDTNISLSLDAAISVTSLQNDASRRKGIITANASFATALESAVFDAEIDNPNKGSPLDYLKEANTSVNNAYHEVTSANYNTWLGLTANYDSATLGRISSYLSDGYTVIAPNSGQYEVNPGRPATPTLGFGFPANVFLAYHPTEQAHTAVIRANETFLKGAISTAPNTGVESFDASIADPGKHFIQPKNEIHGVVMGTGNFTYTPGPDLVTGSGGFPYSLAFQRSYNADSGEIGQYGRGWTHTLDLRLFMNSDIIRGFGGTSAFDAASTLAALTTAVDIAEQGYGLDVMMSLPFVSMWWVGESTDNIASVSQGAQTVSYARLADGSFNPPPGMTSKLAKTGARATDIGTYDVIVDKYVYDYSGITFAHTLGDGSVQRFTRIANDQANERDMHVLDWTFLSGVVLTYTYDAQAPGQFYFYGKRIVEISSSLGRKLTFDDGIFAQPSVSSGTGAFGVEDESGRKVMLPLLKCGTVNYGGFSVPFTKDVCLRGVTTTTGDITQYTYNAEITGTTPVGSYYLPGDPLANTEAYFKLAEIRSAANLGGTYPDVTVAYDRLGRVQELYDAFNNKTEYFVGGIGSATRSEVVDALGGVTVTYYDDSNRIVRQLDPLGQEVQLVHDGLGRVMQATLPEGNKVTYAYDSLQSSYAYDTRSNLTSVAQIPRVGSSEPTLTHTYSYHTTWPRLAQYTDAASAVTDYSYFTSGNGIGQVKDIKLPTVGGLRPMSSATYNALGQMIQKIDPEGLITDIGYDVSDNLDSVTVDPSGFGYVTTFGYDPIGNILTVNGPRTDVTDVTTYAYDDQRRVSQVTDALSNIAKVTYDGNGRVVKEERATGNAGDPWQVTTSTYDASGNVVQTFDPDGNLTTTTYDALGRTDVVRDAEGRKSKTVYDAAGQVTHVYAAWRSGFADTVNDNFTCDPIANSLQQCYQRNEYDANGNLTLVRDAKANPTAYAYDGHDRMSTATFPDTTYEAYTYNTSGNMLTKRVRSGEIIAYTYDALGRETLKDVPTNVHGYDSDIETTYDLTSRILSKKHVGHNETTDYLYDALGRLTDLTHNGSASVAHTLGYAYDKASNRTQVTHPDAFVVNYEYDALNRMIQVKEGTTPQATYAYDDLSRRTAITLGNGRVVSYDYETKDNDLTSLDHEFGPTGSVTTVAFDYAYNRVGQLIDKQISDASFQWTPPGSESKSYTTNSLNQYTAVGASALTYDARGNLLSDSVQSYQYDVENRLLEVTTATETYKYYSDANGALGARVEGTSSGNSTGVKRYIVSEDQVILDFYGTLDFDASRAERRYIYGAGIDQPLVMIDEQDSSKHYYYHQDRQGNVIALSNDTGAMQEQYTYSAFGVSNSTVGNPYRYTGRRLDADTGLYYYRARYYSPELGRFLQTDPIGYDDQMNLYAYVGNDPMTFNDPTGQWAVYLKIEVVFVIGGIGFRADAGVGLDLGTGEAFAYASGGGDVDLLMENGEVQGAQIGIGGGGGVAESSEFLKAPAYATDVAVGPVGGGVSSNDAQGGNGGDQTVRQVDVTYGGGVGASTVKTEGVKGEVQITNEAVTGVMSTADEWIDQKMEGLTGS